MTLSEKFVVLLAAIIGLSSVKATLIKVRSVQDLSQSLENAQFTHAFVLFHGVDFIGNSALQAFNQSKEQNYPHRTDFYFAHFPCFSSDKCVDVYQELQIPQGLEPPLIVHILPPFHLASFHHDTLASRFLINQFILKTTGEFFQLPRLLTSQLPAMKSYQKMHLVAHKVLKQVKKKAGNLEKYLNLAEQYLQESQQSPNLRIYASTFRKLIQRVAERGSEGFEEERMRVSRLLSGNVILSEARRHQFEMHAQMLSSFEEKVPKLVHFIKTDSAPEKFTLMNYLAIRSAHYYIQPERIIFHTVVQPEGKWWDRARPYVQVRILKQHEIPVRIGNKVITLAAHAADVLRVEILNQMGGIYLDLDVITIKSFDTFLHYPITTGLEKAVDRFEEVASNAVLISRPNQPFLRRIFNVSGLHFEPEKCYTCHSVILNRDLALSHPEEINVVSWRAFSYPGWEADAYRILFGSDDASEVDFRDTYAIHLFSSNGNYMPYAHMMDESYITTVDSNFNRLVRHLL